MARTCLIDIVSLVLKEIQKCRTGFVFYVVMCCEYKLRKKNIPYTTTLRLSLHKLPLSFNDGNFAKIKRNGVCFLQIFFITSACHAALSFLKMLIHFFTFQRNRKI